MLAGYTLSHRVQVFVCMPCLSLLLYSASLVKIGLSCGYRSKQFNLCVMKGQSGSLYVVQRCAACPCPAPAMPLLLPLCDLSCVVLQVTYSSDHFDQLYKLAVKLIETGHAYVDHQTATEIKESRCVPLGLLLP